MPLTIYPVLTLNSRGSKTSKNLPINISSFRRILIFLKTFQEPGTGASFDSESVQKTGTGSSMIPKNFRNLEWRFCDSENFQMPGTRGS
jgi:hypothetical protein